MTSADRAKPVAQLLWLEPGGTDRLWEEPAFAPLLEPLEQAPKDEPAHAYARSLTLAPEAFREVLAVLAKAEPVAEAGLAAALARASASGTVVPPVAVTAGEMELAFNPRDELAVAAAVAAALVTGDDATEKAVELAQAVPAPLGPGAAPTVAKILAQLRQACAQAATPLAPSELDAEVARALLGAQRAQRRELFGAEHLRGLLHIPDGAYPLVVYLPAEAASHLPQLARFEVRALVEVHPPQDPVDPGPVALRVVGLARVCPKPRWEA
jgi:hypothetical protein